MINKIVFVWDFLYHDSSNGGTYHWYAVDLMRSQIKLSTGMDVIELCELKNEDGERFSRKIFYKLSGYEDIATSYFSYDLSKITQKSIDYLKRFIDSNTFVLGFEIGLDLRKILTDMNVNFINFWYHAWKLFDDSFLMLNTNNEDIYNKLQQYKVPEEKFRFCAKYWKYFTIRNHDLNYIDHLKDNSCLFVGQTMRDKAIDKDGVMLNILNFKDKLKELSKQYSKIYYTPHPMEYYVDEIDDYIRQIPYIEKLERISTHHLIMSDKIKKVLAISSSVLFEAQFFDKEIEYLYKPLFKIDEEFSLETFISIFHDYYNPYFWADVLSVLMNTNENVENKVWFVNIDNKFRNINHLYYGYYVFNENCRLYDRITNETDSKIEVFRIENKFNKYKFKYQLCRILCNMTFGKLKNKIKKKKRVLQNSIRFL